MLTIKGLSFAYDEQPLLRHMDISIAGGQLVGIIGPNGSGKSTLLKLIAGLLPFRDGQISLNEQSLASLSATQRARKISYLPQMAEVHWPLTVREVVALGRLPYLNLLQGLNDFDQALITQSMSQTQVLELAHKKISSLSSGERARVMLARMLATQADVLMADEPVANLDLYHQMQTMELLREHAKSGGIVLTVMHDINLGSRYCDQLLLLHKGRLHSSGAAVTVLTAENLASTYAVHCHIDQSLGYPQLLAQKRLTSAS